MKKDNYNKYRIDIYDIKNPYVFTKRFCWILQSENQAKELIRKFLKHNDYGTCLCEVNRIA